MALTVRREVQHRLTVQLASSVLTSPLNPSLFQHRSINQPVLKTITPSALMEPTAQLAPQGRRSAPTDMSDQALSRTSMSNLAVWLVMMDLLHPKAPKSVFHVRLAPSVLRSTAVRPLEEGCKSLVSRPALKVITAQLEPSSQRLVRKALTSH
jgi:hypothetical protein